MAKIALYTPFVSCFENANRVITKGFTSVVVNYRKRFGEVSTLCIFFTYIDKTVNKLTENTRFT